MTDKTVWDKSNIGENYPGITLPLTYSFIREAYKNVYISFLKILKVDNNTIKTNSYVLENMLGYINGEVFYNIDNWYKFLQILPGYRYNKEFFETMLDPVEKRSQTKVRLNTFNVIKSLPTFFRLIFNVVFMQRHYLKFDKGYNNNLNYYNSLVINKLSNKQLTSEFNNIENHLFSLWGHAIVNDFRVMVLYGLYSRFINKKYANDTNKVSEHIKTLTNKPESLKLIVSLIKIAIEVKNKNIKLSNISRLKTDSHLVYSQVIDYIEKYGERSFNELKLEQTNFKDNPNQLLELIHYYSTLDTDILNAFLEKEITSKSKDFQPSSLSIDKFIYFLLKNSTINAINKREEFRIKRAKVFKIANDFFKEMAFRLKSENIINNTNDIYYLYKSEIIETLNNHRVKENFNVYIHERKQNLTNYSKNTQSRRILTSGIYGTLNSTNTAITPQKAISSRITSPGSYNNISVVTMNSLEFNINLKDKILVTHATDPGWTMLFPLLKGVIIEEGGMLSHASVIARELEIPCCIVPSALKTFKTDDVISLNGQTGLITIN